MISFNSILSENGISFTGLRLVRHQERHFSGRTSFSLWQRQDGSFERYQQIQGKTPFRDATSIASFVVNHHQETVFVGLYKVIGSELNLFPVFCPLRCEERLPGTVTLYELHSRPELAEMSGRLIVDWGKSTRAWVQIAEKQNKAVLAIDRIVSEPAFPGFQSIVVDTNELMAIPKSWQTALSAAQGIYLLVCQQTGEQYVGSAYGETGFWGRWQGYANGGHGGNALLRPRKNAVYKICILDTSPMSASAEMVIALEQEWKQKLGSRAHGLNAN
jgi:hypothetical protein